MQLKVFSKLLEVAKKLPGHKANVSCGFRHHEYDYPATSLDCSEPSYNNGLPESLWSDAPARYIWGPGKGGPSCEINGSPSRADGSGCAEYTLHLGRAIDGNF